MRDSRCVMVRAADVRVGAMIDLEGDSTADPRGNSVVFQYELQTVASVDRETPECVAIGLEGIDVFGFPPNHMLAVVKES